MGNGKQICFRFFCACLKVKSGRVPSVTVVVICKCMWLLFHESGECLRSVEKRVQVMELLLKIDQWRMGVVIFAGAEGENM